MIQDNQDRICDALYEDLHKHRFETIGSDVRMLQDDIVHTYQNLDKWTADDKPAPYAFLNFLGGAVVKKEPLGVSLIIGAWNYPFLLLFQPVVAAIAAGCAVFVKVRSKIHSLFAVFGTQIVSPEWIVLIVAVMSKCWVTATIAQIVRYLIIISSSFQAQ